ncbi:MAG: DUF2252 domain-containing protein [Lapillicoccus sp.]
MTLEPAGWRTAEDRAALGRAERGSMPREALAELVATDHDAVDLVVGQEADRLQNLLPIRHGRMLASPFAFYRGSAVVMAYDLVAGPCTSLTSQLCGDAHLSNFGLYGSPERQLVFDLNDFDETWRGPFEWDVKRLAASVELAGGRANEYPARRTRRIVVDVVRAYREAMRSHAQQGNLDVWYSYVSAQKDVPQLFDVLDKPSRKAFTRTIDKARTRDSLGSRRKLTEVVDGRLRLVSRPPLVIPSRDLNFGPGAAELERWITELIDEYATTLSTNRRQLLEQYRFVDIALKVVGVGSVGTRAWVVLLVGRDEADPLFLQSKEAVRSVLDVALGSRALDNHGQRVVEGQRNMQAVSDVMLGWQRATRNGVSTDYYVRQLHDWKGSLEIEGIPATGLETYARICAQTLARAHARSGDRIAIAAYLGGRDVFDEAVGEFAGAYADKAEADYAKLRAAAADGRLAAEYDV